MHMAEANSCASLLIVGSDLESEEGTDNEDPDPDPDPDADPETASAVPTTSSQLQHYQTDYCLSKQKR